MNIQVYTWIKFTKSLMNVNETLVIYVVFLFRYPKPVVFTRIFTSEFMGKAMVRWDESKQCKTNKLNISNRFPEAHP